MEREDKKKEADKEQMKETISDVQNKLNSSAKPSDGKSADDDVVKDENIPVTYINTSPNVPKK
ncbi:hypothetical protein DXT99_10700 [Pontibacter diazotrophicus]|uniref:Uncharacterized protein n=1 Tax=Pontibacter diazotrophicus TaxID=1400979 RepID=A0A3D8LCX6_9BACT|nr:hypothetical protein [Pontibacter diazotrophicus]RDV15134.1 hypothetical protein DXT99_10700 [Pontibacter diazotrophicus]